MITIEPIDRVKEINRDGCLFVPIGHYALSNSKNILLNQSPSILIYGLGSCIALVLFDELNKVSAINNAVN